MRRILLLCRELEPQIHLNTGSKHHWAISLWTEMGRYKSSARRCREFVTSSCKTMQRPRNAHLIVLRRGKIVRGLQIEAKVIIRHLRVVGSLFSRNILRYISRACHLFDTIVWLTHAVYSMKRQSLTNIDWFRLGISICQGSVPSATQRYQTDPHYVYQD